MNLKYVQKYIVSNLPVNSRWFIDGTTLDFDFSASRDELRPLPEGRDQPDLDDPANDLLVIGLQDFSEGGGARPWLCLRKSDGWICGFDSDCEVNPIFNLNSSVQRFVETFRFLNQYLQRNEPLPPDSARLLAEIDPKANSTSNWTSLVDRFHQE
ncbi:MAG: hypothetical protein U0930_17355 [Pirellulales bacterium]